VCSSDLNGDREWRFKIRTDLKFSDGRSVNPEIIKTSLKRTIFLLSKSGSKNEFVKFLNGIEQFSKLESEIPGISVEKEELVFRFRKPVPKLLELVSFGVFSVADPRSFNPITGEWLSADFSKTNGLGPYEIQAVESASIKLALKKGYPTDLYSSSAAPVIEFFSRPDGDVTADLYFGTSDSELFSGGTHRFFGRGNRNIQFFQFIPWRDPENVFSKAETRRIFTGLFLKKIREKKLQTTNSFFPLVMPGIYEIEDAPVDLAEIKSLSGKVVRFTDSRPLKSKRINLVMEALEETITDLGMIPVSLKNFPLESVQTQKRQKEDFTVDIAFMGTGISLEDPMADIRLMFSKEGIDIPDSTGVVSEIIEDSTFEPQKVNEEIYRQRIVVPVTHYDLGLWANPVLDVSDYNTLKPPGELQWIGVK
jgi:ABC-type oligopeptide transport system substrate-binding subunit